MYWILDNKAYLTLTTLTISVQAMVQWVRILMLSREKEQRKKERSKNTE